MLHSDSLDAIPIPRRQFLLQQRGGFFRCNGFGYARHPLGLILLALVQFDLSEIGIYDLAFAVIFLFPIELLA
jgi:hypothetical protein